MGYNVYSLRERNGGSEVSEFKRAAKRAKEAVETMCELAEEMEDRFSERMGDDYSERGSYSRRYDDYSERRMRDSRGHYM